MNSLNPQDSSRMKLFFERNVICSAGSNPVESPEFFRFMRQFLKLSSKCDDHIFIWNNYCFCPYLWIFWAWLLKNLGGKMWDITTPWLTVWIPMKKIKSSVRWNLVKKIIFNNRCRNECQTLLSRLKKQKIWYNWFCEPNNYTSTLTPKMAINKETSVYFSTNTILGSCHAPP